MAGAPDPFDPDRFRLSPQLAAKLAQAKAECDASKRNGNKPGWSTGAGKRAINGSRSQKRFTKFPGTWEEVLGKAHVSGSTYAVAIVLLHEAWKLTSRGNKPVVKLTGEMLKRAHVGKRGKRAALCKLEHLKLVGVERRTNRNPLVAVYFVE